MLFNRFNLFEEVSAVHFIQSLLNRVYQLIAFESDLWGLLVDIIVVVRYFVFGLLNNLLSASLSGFYQIVDDGLSRYAWIHRV